jgi:hypothetical protein
MKKRQDAHGRDGFARFASEQVEDEGGKLAFEMALFSRAE